MTTLDRIEHWRSTGAITAEQYASISAIVRKDRFSVFLELNALLYLGVLSLACGLGWTVYAHFADLGDVTVVLSLAALIVGSLAYCFSRAASYAHARVESPSFAFDYVLYLGCLAFGVELGFLEYRFHLLQQQWDFYLLASAILYFVLAYRFDNQFVLSLALSALGGWFGLRFSTLGSHISGPTRGAALAYGALVAASGWWMWRLGVKAHFLDSYLHVAANVALAALVTGAIAGDERELWLLGLAVAAAFTMERGVRRRRFEFVTYGAVYGYVGLSAEILRHLSGQYSSFGYFIVSGAVAIVSLTIVARRVGREP